ncbi:flavodoxin family protein [Nocardioides sp. R-C-SC26]|uniref:flavodoxin family protein n=1 Tax=Nocardioides sp. R-C-SC26 TaxID=2870414 RepID=UPI001E5F1884|nr:flavodoxin family protein [Nocardioides sp. R-C-SC26]
MATLLVIHHAPTPSLRALSDSVIAGARDDALDDVQVRSIAALEASAEDVVAADGVVLTTSANFGYMSGALKHFFDSAFLQIGGALDDGGGAGDDAGVASPGGRLPFGLLVHGRYDTTGAVRSVLAITGALPWRQVAPVLEVLGDVGDAEREAAYELGATVAALLT